MHAILYNTWFADSTKMVGSILIFTIWLCW